MICPTCEGDGIERCTNPDHGFIQELVFTDIGRLGCPCCGHDEKHRIVGCKCPDCDGTGIIEGAKNTEQQRQPYLQTNKGGKVDVKKTYFESGALLSEAPYKNGKEHGAVKWYHESGALKWEALFVNGKKHGAAKEYYESGALLSEAPYKNGKLHGVKKVYSESGELLRTTEYKNDSVVKSK